MQTVCHEIHQLIAKNNEARWNQRAADNLIADTKDELHAFLRTAGRLTKEATDGEIKRALMGCGYRILAHGQRFKISS